MPDPSELPALPQDRINVLLVTARPFENDVDYRSISRPLVDLIRNEKLPASVQVLRPPTFDNLVKHLKAKPGYYHILHFDGHGGYGSSAPDPAAGLFRGHEGRLMFEKGDGTPDEITASVLDEQLKGCTVPFVVLNACRSARLDAQAVEGRAFASVAGALVHAGFRGVLAMAYNLTVIGAQQFLPVFYRNLFKQGNLLETAREGRRQMHLRPSRSAWNPNVKLQDWLLPVVYQQREDFDLSFGGRAAPPGQGVPLPEAASVSDALAFVGRDEAIHGLERALRAAAAGILVHGLAGVGKTTLIRHFLQWLRDTGGLEHPPLWFGFDDIRSAAFVFNQIGRAVLGSQFDSDQPDHYTALINALRKNPLLLVWDNFESARGFQPERVSGLLSEADQHRLRDFLQALLGGCTKVLLTSRSEEAWLPAEVCRRIPLGGLRREELWDYATSVIETLQLPVDRNDIDLQALLGDLDGHPVLIRAVLAQLPVHTAVSLRRQRQENLPAFLAQGSDPVQARLMATLQLVGGAFTETEKAYLIPLAIHERYVNLTLLHAMGYCGVRDYQSKQMESIVERLVRAGLLTGLGQNTFALHPLLTSYLGVRALPAIPDPQRETWERVFVIVMGVAANSFAHNKLPEQRGTFGMQRANFHHALELASARGMAAPSAALTLSLAADAEDTQNYAEAAALFQRMAEHYQQEGRPAGEAAAYHRLGVIAEKQRAFTEAERWYLKSLAISEKQGNDHGAADTYHQLGMIAQKQRDFAEAERWCHKALAISEKQGDEHGAAITYNQLGIIAEEQGDSAGAERWHLKSLAISEKRGDEHDAASNYHELGINAQAQRDFVRAERWYLKSLAIKEKQGDELGAANTYNQLGSIAEEQGDFATAERWHLKSLAISEKQGNEYGAATTYHHLGIVAQMRRDLDGAERWYLKSLAISEKQGDEYGAAGNYHQLGMISEEQGDARRAGELFLKAFGLAAPKNDKNNAGIALGSFARLFQQAPAAARENLRAMGLKALGNKLMEQVEKSASEG